MFYRKKPLIIEAIEIGGGESPHWYLIAIQKQDIVVSCDPKGEIEGCHILTLGGAMYGKAGDYIIKGVDGELYPCKAGVFHKTYDEGF